MYVPFGQVLIVTVSFLFYIIFKYYSIARSINLEIKNFAIICAMSANVTIINAALREEDSSDASQSRNIPKTRAGTITSSLNNSYELDKNSNSCDDDCVIVDATPISIICIDEQESEKNLIEYKTDDNNINNAISNEKDNNEFHNPTLDNISSIGDSTCFNVPEDRNPLFVVDPKPGFNGSKVPLYHSFVSCAQSTPLRNHSDINQSNMAIQNYDSENKTAPKKSQASSKNCSDSDVILIQDDGESFVSKASHDLTVDESVIFCGIEMVRTPIRRIETTTPSPNKFRVLSPTKRNYLGRLINHKRTKGYQSRSNDDTITETIQNSFKSPSAGGKRIVIIDGCNVAFGHGNNKKFSAEGIEIALKYFERKGHETKIVVPQFRLRNQQSTNQGLMHRLQDTDKLVVTPSKNLPGKMSSSYDDRFILQLAEEFDAAIISNDNYRDLLLENPAWKNIIETRVIGYTWLKDFFMVPTDPYGKLGPKLDDILNKNV